MKPDPALPATIEALIEEEVTRRLTAAVAAQQEQFAAAMQAAMQGALGGVDQAGAALEQERAAVAEERQAVQELYAKADREGERLASEAREKHWRQYDEAARLGLLRTLVRRKVESGNETPEIAAWFMVEPEFVDEIRRVVETVTRFRREREEFVRPPGARVTINTEGRGGTIIYESPETRFELWWEMGSTALAIVDVPPVEQWTQRTGLAPYWRRQVLAFIGEEITSRHAPGGSFLIGENVLTIYSAS